MKKAKQTFLWISALALILFVACERDSELITDSEIETENEDVKTLVDDVENIDDHDSASDYTWNSTDIILIVLNGSSITASGSGVTVDGSKATITSAGTYKVSGTLTDGQLLVNTEDEAIVRLILSGVNMNCSTNAPIYVENAEKAMIVLADNTENTVTDGTTYSSTEEDANAAIFCKSDLTIYGDGSLTVKGNYNDGITSKDGLIIASGNITINAVDDGIRGKDYLVIKDGNITVDVIGDGLKSDNEEDAGRGYITVDNGALNITANGDAIQAAKDVMITFGEITLSSGGGSSSYLSANASAKGIKSGISTIIHGGIINIDAADDAIHSNGTIEIGNGIFSLASGDDGIHTDVLIEDGFIDVTKSYEGIESSEGNITVNGGEIYLTTSDDGFNISAGGGGMGGGPWHKSTTVTRYALTINDGYIVVNAGGDGLDSNDDITINDGHIIVSGSTASSNSTLDCDGTLLSNGGFLIATGTSRMAMAPSSSSSTYSMMVNYNSTQQAGTMVHIQDDKGNDILSLPQSILLS